MTGIDEGERPTCPICGDETYGRPCERSYCAGHRAGYQRGHEAGHEDAGLAAIARASAAYEAGYAACRETMTPAVLATEDAYLLGHEAGRLAAIRDDVDIAARQLERRAEEALDRARGLQSVLDSADFLFGIDRAEMQAESDEGRIKAELLTAKAADCRRWLEATS